MPFSDFAMFDAADPSLALLIICAIAGLGSAFLMFRAIARLDQVPNTPKQTNDLVLPKHPPLKTPESPTLVPHPVGETAPLPIWEEESNGTITWCNRFYQELAGKTGATSDKNAIPRLFNPGQILKPGATPPSEFKRSTVLTTNKRGEKTEQTFELQSFVSGTRALHFASDATRLVRAEQNLRKFTQTMTKTFADLPIGLAIFDRSRRLVIFNPGLLDLTGLKPEWLSARPSLGDFLNQLREYRMLPEKKDFHKWRAKITEFEKSGEEGHYRETWCLPNGLTYRVSGHPHPDGAIAFLFEDISAEVSLTRKFRRELVVSESVFDNLSKAVAVFNRDGSFLMSNLLYTEIWGASDADKILPRSIAAISAGWAEQCQPSPIWGDFRDFVTEFGEKAEWTATVEHKLHGEIDCRFCPTEGGTTLVEFSPRRQLIRPVQELAKSA